MISEAAARAKTRTCAYCGVDGPFTREEVFARFAVRTAAPVKFRSTASGRDWLLSPPAVRDVCAPCNNGPLSELDNAAKPIIERLLTTTVQPGERLHADVRTLVRWLLKVSYNSARATGDQLEGHRLLAGFILGMRATPPFALDCLLGRLDAHPVRTDDGRPRPMVRVGDLVTPELRDELQLGRLASVNSLLFQFLGWRGGVSARRRDEVRAAMCRDYRLTRLRLGSPLVVPLPAVLDTAEFVERFDFDAPAMLRQPAEETGQ